MFRVAEPRKPLQLNNENATFIRCVVIVAYLCQMLLLYNRSTFEPICGLILAACSAMLMFTPFYYVPVSVVMLTPHAMGTVILGRLSLYTFVGCLLIFRLFIVRFKITFTLTDLWWLFLGLFNWIHTLIFLTDYIGTEKLAIMLFFTLWMIYIRCDSHKKQDIYDRFLLAYAFAILVNATVSLFTRSATIYESSDRMGLIGVSSNDPNIAAMFITIGVAIFMSSNLIKIWLKIIACVLLFFSLITTVSISGFVAAVLVVLIFAIIMNKNKKNISVLLVILLGALLAVYIFPMLGIMGEKNTAGETVNYLEYFQEKINEKAGSFLGEDIDNATSGRSELTHINMQYFAEQSGLRQLFGGNHVNPLGVNVSHNSFADILLRFGYIGLIIVFVIMCYSLLKCLQRTRDTRDCTVLLCKLLLIYWSLTLSLFEGSSAILWFALVLMF